MSDPDLKKNPIVASKDDRHDLDQSLPHSGGLAQLSYSEDITPNQPGQRLFAPGDLLANRFRVVSFISKGGMGEVYEAEDLELHERIAIKTVSPSIAASPSAIEQFKREIQLARKVTHPNVCRIFDLVYDSRASGSIAFLTMELLQGPTLSSYLEGKGTLPLQEALVLARQMADGLNAAHRAGVIHQDFKTSNVILVKARDDSALRAVITDFGLAHNARVAEQNRGRSVGTPAYMAPEQIEGGAISVATDVYAFGVVLYELVTGHWPYNARNVEELQTKKLSQAPIAPSKYIPDLPIRVERTLLRCLEKKPDHRYGDVLQVVSALERPRRTWVRAIAAGLILAALGVIGGYLWRKNSAMIGEPTVAVIGFTNSSGDSKYDWLATELSESLNTDLGGSKGLHSVPTDEVASVKTELSTAQNQSLEHEDLSSVREALGANYLLLGRYALPESSSLSLDVLLQDARGRTVSDIHESGPAGEYRKLLADAASQVRDKLGKARLSDIQLSELQNLYPQDADASQLYFQGLDKLRAFDGPTALLLLQKAAERDSDNVSIHSALADAWAQLRRDPEAAKAAQTAAVLAQKASLPQEYVVLTQARAAEMNKQWSSAIDDYRSLFLMYPRHLNYGLHLASAQIGGSRPADALGTLTTLSTLPAPMGNDPRITITKARAYEAMSDFNSELSSAQISLAQAQKRNARMMQAQAQLALCWAHRNLGHVDAAYSACNEAQSLFSVFGDNVSAAVALNDVATWLTDRGQYAQAKQLYDRVIEANQKAGDQKDYAGACINAAVALRFLGKWQDAEDYVVRALQAARASGDKYDESVARLNLGEILARQGRLSEAEKETQDTLGLARELKNQSIEGRALSNLAEYQSETNSQSALATYREALKLRRQGDDQGGVAVCLNNIGDLLFRRDDLKGAQASYDQAMSIDSQLKNKSALAHDSVSLAELDLERGNFELAENKLTQAIQEFRGEQDSDSESEAASIQIKVLIAENKLSDAAVIVTRIRDLASKDLEISFENRLSLADYLHATNNDQQAIEQIASLPQEAKNAGMNFVSLRARLALVRLRGRNPRVELRKELSAIRADAKRAGFLLLLKQAGSA